MQMITLAAHTDPDLEPVTLTFRENANCWCSRAATRLDGVDPEVTTWDGETVINTEGVQAEPAMPRCEMHTDGGWALIVPQP